MRCYVGAMSREESLHLAAVVASIAACTLKHEPGAEARRYSP